jgi:hypothetical protein
VSNRIPLTFAAAEAVISFKAKRACRAPQAGTGVQPDQQDVPTSVFTGSLLLSRFECTYNAAHHSKNFAVTQYAWLRAGSLNVNPSYWSPNRCLSFLTMTVAQKLARA